MITLANWRQIRGNIKILQRKLAREVENEATKRTDREAVIKRHMSAYNGVHELRLKLEGYVEQNYGIARYPTLHIALKSKNANKMRC